MSQFPGGGPDFNPDGSRGAYLLWLDTRIKKAKHDGGLSSELYKALVAARKAFTDEFYPK